MKKFWKKTKLSIARFCWKNPKAPTVSVFFLTILLLMFLFVMLIVTQNCDEELMVFWINTFVLKVIPIWFLLTISIMVLFAKSFSWRKDLLEYQIDRAKKMLDSKIGLGMNKKAKQETIRFLRHARDYDRLQGLRDWLDRYDEFISICNRMKIVGEKLHASQQKSRRLSAERLKVSEEMLEKSKELEIL